MKASRNFQAKYNRHLIVVGVLSLLLAIAAYIYFLSLSVVHVVMRKEIEQELNSLRSEIAYLETSYIEARHNISSSLATAEGFTLSDNKIFLNQGEPSLVLRTQN